MNPLTVYKYPIEVEMSLVTEGRATILNLPVGATILRVMNQNNGLVLYAVVDAMEQRYAPITILVRMTGDPFAVPEYPNMIRYLDTVCLYEGQLVLHVFIIEDRTKYRLGAPVWAEAPSVPFQEAGMMPLSGATPPESGRPC